MIVKRADVESVMQLMKPMPGGLKEADLKVIFAAKTKLCFKEPARNRKANSGHSMP